MATVGRKKRKRRPGSGTGVKAKAHTRAPRGPDRGKPRVKVDSYSRGRPKRRKGSKKR